MELNSNITCKALPHQPPIESSLRGASPFGDCAQLTKFGNSKIYVVKKKPPQQAVPSFFNSTGYHTLSQQKSLLEGYSNSEIKGGTSVPKAQTTANSLLVTPSKGQTVSNFSPLNQPGRPSPLEFKSNGAQQTLTINTRYEEKSRSVQKISATPVTLTNQKHVDFDLEKQAKGQASQSLSVGRAEESRVLNSKREFQIRKSRKKSKERGLKSPSDFTNVAKSFAGSLFSTHSGKTNHSAPLGLDANSLSESPKHAKQIKKQVNNGVKSKSKINKKKVRPSSSTSAGGKQHFSMTGTNFSKGPAQASFLNITGSKERSESANSKKVIPLKQIKFPTKKIISQNTTASLLPKPPLHKKQAQQDEASTTEALLKMADEGLASIEHELSQSKKGAKKHIKRILLAEGSKDLLKVGKRNEVQTSFNLSFNNSFNTSYNNSDPQVLAFSTAPAQASHAKEGGDSAPPQYQGFFTADAVYLEKQLTNRLKEASDNESKKMQAFNQTFNEIIKRDKNFGSLLLKIKQAYDEYLRKSTVPCINSPVEKPTVEELQTKIVTVELAYQASLLKCEEMAKQMATLREELEGKQKSIDQLQGENDRLSGNFESFKGSNIRVNKSVSNMNETMKSLVLSQSSNRTGSQMQLNRPFLQSSNIPSSPSNNHLLMNDLNYLLAQNMELSTTCQAMSAEMNYLRLREKKVMYLVYLLQTKGFAVSQIFEAEVKPIETLRFQEFLDSHPQLEGQIQAELEDDPKALFSFRSDDSYDLLVKGPSILQKKPAIVPVLDLNSLPDYESSSSEGDAEPHYEVEGTNPQHYQESLKYIENFYSKYAKELKQTNITTHSMDSGIIPQQLSEHDSLSRDEEEDIKEQIEAS